MRTINDNMTLERFQAWSEAVETKETILNHHKAEAFDQLIEELYPDGIDETQLNDPLWFEEDWLFEVLGIETEEEDF